VAILATALGYPNHTGPKSKISCLHDQPEAGKVCFTVSDVCVGVISHPWWGLDAPDSTHVYNLQHDTSVNGARTLLGRWGSLALLTVRYM